MNRIISRLAAVLLIMSFIAAIVTVFWYIAGLLTQSSQGVIFATLVFFSIERIAQAVIKFLRVSFRVAGQTT